MQRVHPSCCHPSHVSGLISVFLLSHPVLQLHSFVMRSDQLVVSRCVKGFSGGLPVVEACPSWRLARRGGLPVVEACPSWRLARPYRPSLLGAHSLVCLSQPLEGLKGAISLSSRARSGCFSRVWEALPFRCLADVVGDAVFSRSRSLASISIQAAFRIGAMLRDAAARRCHLLRTPEWMFLGCLGFCVCAGA